MGFIEFLWILLDFNGLLWFLVHLDDGFSRMFTDFDGFQWILWNLKMTFGWNTPSDPTGTVFSGVQGQRILRTIGDMKTTFSFALELEKAMVV